MAGHECLPLVGVLPALQDRCPIGDHEVDLEAGLGQIRLDHLRGLVLVIVLRAGQDPDRLALVAGLLQQRRGLVGVALVVAGRLGIEPGGALRIDRTLQRPQRLVAERRRQRIACS